MKEALLIGFHVLWNFGSAIYPYAWTKKTKLKIAYLKLWKDQTLWKRNALSALQLCKIIANGAFSIPVHKSQIRKFYGAQTDQKTDKRYKLLWFLFSASLCFSLHPYFSSPCHDKQELRWLQICWLSAHDLAFKEIISWVYYAILLVPVSCKHFMSANWRNHITF